MIVVEILATAGGEICCAEDTGTGFERESAEFGEHRHDERREKLIQTQRTLMKEQEPSTWKRLSHEDVTGTFLSGFGSISVSAKNPRIAQTTRVSRGRNFFSEAISENENKDRRSQLRFID